MGDYGFVHQDKTYTPNATAGIAPADNDARNRAIEARELEYWQTAPERFAPAYYSFPAEGQPLFGRPRTWRASFSPVLHTYIEKTTPDAPGTANHAIVTTWLGTKIGVIVSARVYTHNFGGRFVSLKIKGTNGASYYGRASWDNGSLIRLRKVKGSK